MSKVLLSVLLILYGVAIAAVSALGGIYLYTRVYGSPADTFASRVVDYVNLLHQPNGLPRGADDIAEKIKENLDMEIIAAGPVFDRMDASHQKLFRDVLAKMNNDKNTGERNDFARRSAKVRSCILDVETISDSTKADCARKAIASSPL